MKETAQPTRQTAFPVTGAIAEHLEPVKDAVRPALLAAYRDLASLRYDFPVVLLEPSAAGESVRSLTSVVNELLQEVAPRGVEGERLRRDVLGAERDIRRLLAGGARGTLTDLWEQAAPELVDVRTGLTVDGELADCDQELPRRVVEHAWRSVQRQKAERFHAEVDRLIQALSEILRAAFIHSEAGRRPESLRGAFGPLHQDQFDFEAMSRLLGKGAPRDELPAERRERIEWALSVLRRQRFFELASGTAPAPEPPYDYRYASCAEALEAFRQRLPEVVEYVKAMSVAALEVDGRYVAAEHHAFFEQFDQDSLGREDLALFPDYLVCVTAKDSAAVVELLSSDVPVKVLVETDQLLDTGRFGFAMRSTQLASTVVGLIDVFVLQTTSSNIYQLRERLLAGLRYPGSALVSVYSGAGAGSASSDVPPYLTSAAALDGRAFPTFTYDPSAQRDFASRFSVDGNPQPELDWPISPLEYADGSLQRVVEEVAFTLADVAVCDPRYAHHFARVPREQWDDSMIPAAQWLSLAASEADARVPYVLVVDEHDSLERLIVDAKLMEAARRCRELWYGLRELASAHESTGAGSTDGSAAAVDEAVEQPAADQPVVEQSAADQSAADQSADAVVEDVAAPSPHEPWIETPRCSTCNECTGINDRMFAYNENKQAYIKDPDAGTFRELVEAAEACQVAVIHPGKPRDPNEPGIEELIERASAFE